MLADPQMAPLSKDDIGEWREHIEQARALRKIVSQWWDANVDAYAPSPSDSPDDYAANLSTNRDFVLVERKKADLFYQQPTVQAVASPLMQGQEALMETHTNILNAKLGVHGVDVKDLVHRALFDVLCPSGTGWTVMGYESTTVDTPLPDPNWQAPMVLDPMTGQPAPDPTAQAPMIMAPVPVHEDCFWRWLSPKQGLIPHTFRSTRWDDAPWLGFDFEWPTAVAKAKGWISPEDKGNNADDELHFDYGLNKASSGDVVKGTVIFYKSALYRQDRPHPLHQTLLILIDGKEAPVEHKDSPYQTLTPEGSLTPDSLLGFPIHPLTIRPMTDSAYVPSDCTLSRPIVNELNRFRSQMVEMRDANIMRWQYNTDVMPPDALAKIVRSPIGGMIGVPGDAFVGEGAIKELPHGSYPRENFSFNDYLDNDLARTHALDSAGSGAQSDSSTTATEANIVQSNVNARLGLERGVVLDWYVKGVTKYSTLLQRFMTAQEASSIVGQQGAQQWDSWRKNVPASLAFTALPDSALRNDIASERKRAMDEYAFLAKDPMINRMELLKHMLPKMHMPMSVLQTQPPQSKPEPAKPNFSFDGNDLNPINPQFPLVVEILRQAGVTISPQAVQEAQAGAMNQAMTLHAQAQDTGNGEAGPNTTHPGKIAQAESLSKHQVDETGGMQGTGEANPMGGVM